MWTGELYGFYSDKPISFIFKKIILYAKENGYKHKYYEDEEEESVLFFKNQKILDTHLEKGYNTNLNDEGCFSIEAKKTGLNGIATLFEFNNKSDFEPFDINLVLNEVFYYVLIVPDFIEDSKFSKKIHANFIKILSNKVIP